MKKTIVTLSAIMLTLSPTVVNAAPSPSIAIIDEHFDTKSLGSNFLEVCVTACSTNLIPNSSQLEDYNHGTMMAEIIHKNNPAARLILIRAGSTNVTAVTSQGLRDALAWVVTNYQANNIGVVSASINAGNPNSCSPVGGVSQSEITSKIDTLSSVGVPLIASAGNTTLSKTLNYPACISNVVAVTSPNRQGIGNSNLDYLVRTSKNNFNGSLGVFSLLNTSAVTALVAANWSSLSKNLTNSGLQINLNVVN